MTGRRADVPQAPDRVARRILGGVQVQPDGCWYTHHALTWQGYAKVGWSFQGKKQTSFGHIVTYEHVHGRVPAGLELDHTCRVRRCVNPGHLEAVTARENVLRSENPAAVNARKTHCPRGHSYSDENTYRFPNGRSCKTCMGERQKERRAREKAERNRSVA